jgi:hypothetical protein
MVKKPRAEGEGGPQAAVGASGSGMTVAQFRKEYARYIKEFQVTPNGGKLDCFSRNKRVPHPPRFEN